MVLYDVEVLASADFTEKNVLCSDRNQRILAKSPALGINIESQYVQACGLGSLPSSNKKLALEEAMYITVPSTGNLIVLQKENLDAVVALAILELRARGGLNFPAIERIKFLHDFIWEYRQKKYSLEALLEKFPSLQGIVPAVRANHRQTLSTRIEWMAEYIFSGEFPEKYWEFYVYIWRNIVRNESEHNDL